MFKHVQKIYCLLPYCHERQNFQIQISVLVSFVRLCCVINSLPPNYRDLKLLKFVFFCFFLTLSTCRWLITWQLCSVLGFSSDIHKSPFSGLAEEASPIWNYSHGWGKKHKMLNWTIQFSLKYCLVIGWHIISIPLVIVSHMAKPKNGMEEWKFYIQELHAIINLPQRIFHKEYPSLHFLMHQNILVNIYLGSWM